MCLFLIYVGSILICLYNGSSVCTIPCIFCRPLGRVPFFPKCLLFWGFNGFPPFLQPNIGITNSMVQSPVQNVTAARLVTNFSDLYGSGTATEPVGCRSSSGDRLRPRIFLLGILIGFLRLCGKAQWQYLDQTMVASFRILFKSSAILNINSAVK
jgi:hypothetical protein